MVITNIEEVISSDSEPEGLLAETTASDSRQKIGISLRGKIILGLCIPLGLVVLLNIGIMVSLLSLLSGGMQITSHSEVISRVKDIKKAMINMELGKNGYLHSGRQEFLNTYLDSKKGLEKIIKPVKELIASNPEQLNRWGGIETAIDVWIAATGDPSVSAGKAIWIEQNERDRLLRVLPQSGMRGEMVKISELLRKMDSQLSRGRNSRAQYYLLLVRKDLAELKAAERGFLLTGGKEFLNSFGNIRESLFKHLKTLESMVNRSYRKDIEEIDAALAVWLEKTAAPAIANRSQLIDIDQSLTRLRSKIGEATGKGDLSDFRKRLADFVKAEVDPLAVKMDKYLATIDITIYLIIFGTIAVVIIALVVVYIRSGNILKVLGGEPLEMVDIAQKIAGQDLTFKFDGDENKMVGLYAAMKVMTRDLNAMLREVASNSEALVGSSGKLSELSVVMAGSADKKMGTGKDMVSDITMMAASSEEMSSNINSISATSTEMSQNMETISGAVEEMTEAIQGVAQKSEEASEVSSKAREMSQSATSAVGTLAQSASEIGEVTEMIKEIAEQTNLLALNANIEAASAGDAGRSFAVVADEIKELAKQSAAAAQKIAGKISGIQDNTDGAVKTIERMAGIINTVSDSSFAITDLAVKQSGTARSMSANIKESALGVGEIARLIDEMAASAEEVAKHSAQLSTSSREISGEISQANFELANVVERLQKIVNNFKLA